MHIVMESCNRVNMQATAQLAGRSEVAGISCIKRFPEIGSNFRTFIFYLRKIYDRKISGNFPNSQP